MNFSYIFVKSLKSLLGVFIFDLLLLTYCVLLGSYFHILHSFSWFGFKIIVLPFSILAFIISFIYLSNHTDSEVNDDRATIESEHSTRMGKFHQEENN